MGLVNPVVILVLFSDLRIRSKKVNYDCLIKYLLNYGSYSFQMNKRHIAKLKKLEIILLFTNGVFLPLSVVYFAKILFFATTVDTVMIKNHYGIFFIKPPPPRVIPRMRSTPGLPGHTTATPASRPAPVSSALQPS